MHFLLISGSPEGETRVFTSGPKNGYQPVSNDNMRLWLPDVKVADALLANGRRA